LTEKCNKFRIYKCKLILQIVHFYSRFTFRVNQRGIISYFFTCRSCFSNFIGAQGSWIYPNSEGAE